MIPLPQILAEFVMALGGALLVANLYAMFRAPKTMPPSRRGSARGAPAGGKGTPHKGRAIVNAVVGFVVLAWGFASFVTRGS